MTRTFGRIAGTLLAVVLLATGCKGSDKATPSDDTKTSTTKQSGPAVASRFTSTSTFCEPATEQPAEAPKATDDGITADSISITHIRVTLEDLEVARLRDPDRRPRRPGEKFVGLINDRCGGINGRKIDLSLVEAPPLAPAGQDRTRSRRPRASPRPKTTTPCSRTRAGLGRSGRRACVTGAHDTIYLTTYNITQEDIEGAGNRLYSLHVLVGRRPEYLARTLDAQGAFDGKTVGVVMADCPATRRSSKRSARHAEGLGVDVKRVDTHRLRRRQLVHHRRDRVRAGDDRRRRRRAVPVAERHQPARLPREMVTQGVKPGQIQFYQSGYNAQTVISSRARSSCSGVPKPGELYNGAEIVANGQTGAFRLPGYEPTDYGEMCNREYQKAGGDKYSAVDPETNSAYGATVGMCTFIRTIARSRKRRA